MFPAWLTLPIFGFSGLAACQETFFGLVMSFSLQIMEDFFLLSFWCNCQTVLVARPPKARLRGTALTACTDVTLPSANINYKFAGLMAA